MYGAPRYLRWCVSGYGMASARFTALKTQVDRVRDMLTKYEGVVETVKGVQQTLATEYTGYSMAVRGDVDDELDTAEHVAEAGFARVARVATACVYKSGGRGKTCRNVQNVQNVWAR
jgi:hypothetical protein